MQTITLEAKTRAVGKKSELKQLRREGFVPATLYHRGEDCVTLTVKEAELRQLVYTTQSHLVNLKFQDGKEKQAVMKDAQFDPVTDSLIHADFLSLKDDEKVEITVPVLYKGTPVGQIKGGKLQVILHKVSVRALPADIPEHIDVDVSILDLSQSVHIGDLRKTYATSKFEILGETTTSLVTLISPSRLAAAEAAAIASPADGAAPAEPEVIAKGKEKGEKEK
ncbi:MAG: 50S ribosomal protein L25/general stress protein Ctc [Chloroherpetonaceae bacterium]|nr:50S ribosomal protein L25/general stress protein Ctc [Chloroherpetonaceae bacterium]